MAVRVPIVEAKLVPPAIAEATVPRPRLLARLLQALKKPLVLLVAEAGYGKTTLLRQAIPTLSARTVWYTLDKHDGDIALFLQYLIRGLRTHFPGFGRTIETTLLRRPGEIPTEALSTVVTCELEKTLKEEVLIVLDDFHEVHRNREIRELLTYLLDHAPTPLHLVIASRVKPAFPLARWRSAGRVAELASEDLRFTPEETQVLCSQFPELLLEEPVVNALHTRTEGWAAGLVLVMQSLRGKSPEEAKRIIRRLSGTTKFIYEYLTQEVYDSLEPELKEFLTHTAILPYLDTPFCNRFLGVTNSADLLTRLEERRLFTFILAHPESTPPAGEYPQEPPVSFRYHPLFQEFLLARLMNEHGPEAAQALHARAAKLLHDQGQEVLAVDHYLSAGQVDEAVELIKRISEPLLARGHRDLVASWLQRLPSSSVASDPHLLYLSGLAAQHLGNWDEARIAYQKTLDALKRTLRTAQDLYEEERFKVLAAKANYELGMLAAMRRAYGEAKSRYEMALDALKRTLQTEGEQDSPLLARIYNGLGVVYANTAMQAQAKEYYTRALSAAERAGDLGSVARIYNNLGVTLAIESGDVTLQEAHGHRALELARRAEDLYVQTILLNSLAYIASIRGRYEAALPLYDQVITLADRCGAMDIKAIALARRSWVYFLLGQKQPAWEDLTQSLDLCRKGQGSEPDSLVFLSHGYLAWEEHEEVLRWLQRSLEAVEGQAYPQDTIAGCCAGLGRVYLRLGKWEQARVHLERGLGLLENTSYWMRPSMQLDLAEVHLREGDVNRAKMLWEATRTLGLTQEIRPALAEVDRMSGLIATREGRWEAAVESFQRSFAGWRHMGRVVDLARTMGELAAMRFEREGHGSKMGQNLLLEALRTSEEVGATRMYQNLLALAGRYGVAVKEEAPTKARLTHREREILRLVAQGLTNKEIAFQLGCSVRTVDTHLRNILERLEVASRSQAVAVAIQEGLL